MKAIGQITIEEGLTLINPTIEIKETKERFETDILTGEETTESLGLWIEMHYTGEGEKITHSRSYPVE